MWKVVCNPTQHELEVNSGTLKKLNAFKEVIDTLIELNESGQDAYNVVREVIQKSGLYALTISDNTHENISKRENLEELVNSAKAFVDIKHEEDSDETDLTNFLAEISLATDQDENSKEEGGPKVTLMTAHAAKGLEYKNIIIVGVEEDLFPSSMSKDSFAQIEEERRLLYVAITRAMITCTITYASSRYQNGQTRLSNPSRFIREINPTYLSLSQTSSSSSDSYNPFANNRKSSKSFWDTEDEDDTKPHVSFHTRRAPTSSSSRLNNKTEVISQKPTLPKDNAIGNTSSQATSAQSDSSNASVHTADELSTGMKIHHFRFGKGVIVQIDTSGSDAKIKVRFSGNDYRVLLLKFAKFEIL
jgi:DNA helicase-2/ATP-dependent DNA helicase PcrA